MVETIEFELRGPGPEVVQVILKLVIFMTKISKAITAKNIAEANAPCFPSPGPSRLQHLS